MILTFSQMNEPQKKEFCMRIFKVSVALRNQIACFICEENLLVGGNLIDFVEKNRPHCCKKTVV